MGSCHDGKNKYKHPFTASVPFSASPQHSVHSPVSRQTLCYSLGFRPAFSSTTMSATPREIGTLVVVVLRAVSSMFRRVQMTRFNLVHRTISPTNGILESKIRTALFSSTARNGEQRPSSAVANIRSGTKSCGSRYSRTLTMCCPGA